MDFQRSNNFLPQSKNPKPLHRSYTQPSFSNMQANQYDSNLNDLPIYYRPDSTPPVPEDRSYRNNFPRNDIWNSNVISNSHQSFNTADQMELLHDYSYQGQENNLNQASNEQKNFEENFFEMSGVNENIPNRGKRILEISI